MGRPHPSHPLTASHLTVYENSQVVWKKNFRRMKLQWMKNQCSKMKGLIVHPVVLEPSCGIMGTPLGTLGSLWEAFIIPRKCSHTTG